MSSSESTDIGSMLLKSLLHYVQIVSVLGLNTIGLGFTVPYAISFLPNIIGEPINTMKNSFDCYMGNNAEVPIIY
jgi:hypothetical protein